MTIILYFTDHTPIRFTGPEEECILQVANARLRPSFISWEHRP
jgi:hypothetical protein